MTKERLLTILLTVLLACSTSTMHAQEEIIEHQGTSYVIHVDRLSPDSEMTLLDVLYLCPEFISNDGKNITAEYAISVDDVTLSFYSLPLLQGIKACDLSVVTICNYGGVSIAAQGTVGTINLEFKEGSKGLDGKVALSGSTYGNGMIYADMKSTGENLTLQAFAHTTQQYGKADAIYNNKVSSRSSTENAMLFANWNLSERDDLKLKFFQGFCDLKDRVQDDKETTIWPSFERYGEFSGIYEHQLNDNEATLHLETYLSYANCSSDTTKERSAYSSWITEFSFPIFTEDLWMLAGWEIDYLNVNYPGLNREQYFNNDFYLQFEYTHGPWVLSIGDRFRVMNYWDKRDYSESLWSHHRNNNAFHASVGYKKDKHFVQGTISHTYLEPSISDFYTPYDEDGNANYFTGYKTNLAWRAEARYNYQTDNLVLTGSLLHTRLTEMIVPNEYLTSFKTSASWHKGPLRLTVGANYHHRHISAGNDTKSVYDNFCTLKLAPTLLLGHGFRLSSVLLYSSKQEFCLYTHHAHLYASVKVNKDLGKRCNIYADFHDIAGQPTGLADDLLQSYKNRALTIGLTYYPFR